ncbi:MAG TPA: hypothetical protein VD866_19080 [Urbifossiella sp.]|nr:hypothetical protein [Urbifossiella sp.]
MRRSVEALLGLLSGTRPVHVAQEDFDGPHGPLLRQWQAVGFVDPVPSAHPVPGCPYCGEGEPYRVGTRLLCAACRGEVAEHELHAWPVRPEAFLADLTTRLGLRGGLQAVDTHLWQLGTATVRGEAVECFYCPADPLTDPARRRLASYRCVLVLSGPLVVPPAGGQERWVPLVELFDADGAFRTPDLAALILGQATVRFDCETGALFVGGSQAGEVPLWSREYYFLACLAEQLDRYVQYADLKRDVLRHTGGAAGAEEATFCQKLKSRIKEKYVPSIDRLVVTSNKADGYRMRAEG